MNSGNKTELFKSQEQNQEISKQKKISIFHSPTSTKRKYKATFTVEEQNDYNTDCDEHQYSRNSVISAYYAFNNNLYS